MPTVRRNQPAIATGGATDVGPDRRLHGRHGLRFPNPAYVKEEPPPVHDRMLALRGHGLDPASRFLAAAFGWQWLNERASAWTA